MQSAIFSNIAIVQKNNRCKEYLLSLDLHRVKFSIFRAISFLQVFLSSVAIRIAQISECFIWLRMPWKAKTELLAVPVALNACAATACLVGTTCVETNGVARCVPPPNNGSNKCRIANEEWRECSGCEASCENKQPVSYSEKFWLNRCVWNYFMALAETLFITTFFELLKFQFCVRMCQPARCQCRQGFFRNQQGQCVTENDCDVAAVRDLTFDIWNI